MLTWRALGRGHGTYHLTHGWRTTQREVVPYEPLCETTALDDIPSDEIIVDPTGRRYCRLCLRKMSEPS